MCMFRRTARARKLAGTRTYCLMTFKRRRYIEMGPIEHIATIGKFGLRKKRRTR